MIANWKDLIYTLDTIRQLRKKPHVEKNPDLHFRLIRAESDVNACIDQKLSEWAAKAQPELIQGDSHE